MKTNHTYEPDVDSPANGLLVDSTRLSAAASRPHRADASARGEETVGWPAADGMSFTAANPWPRGGLNE